MTAHVDLRGCATLLVTDNYGDPFFVHLIYQFGKVSLCNVVVSIKDNNVTERFFLTKFNEKKVAVIVGNKEGSTSP